MGGEGDKMYKGILSILLVISALLVLYPQVNNFSEIPINALTTDAKNQLFSNIIGLCLLFFVVFCAIWAIPETTVRQRTEQEENNTHTNIDIEEIKPKDENIDEMIEKGYIFNVKTGKWEKPNQKKKT
jgi:hypothetical protein